MNFPSQALEVIEKLNKEGYQAYLVGGALRDALQGKEPGDIDLATSALPQEVMGLFSDEKIIPTGLKHGTVTLIYKGLSMEITTFRTDGDYEDYRRPSSVSFSSSLKEDLKRRDFTINALAYHPKEGLIDYVGGLKDLEDGIIRAVGNPKERFNEDALRMLRAIRFVSILGFEMEEETKSALFENKELIQMVSQERLQQELSKLLMGQWVEEALLNYHEIISVFIPEIIPMVGFDQMTPYHCYDVWTHTAKVVAFSKKDLAHRLAGLFHDIAKPQTLYVDDKNIGHFPGHCVASKRQAEKILTKLGYSKKLQNRVLNIILHHNTGIYPEELAIKKSLFYWGPEVFFDIIEFKYADNLAKEPGFVRSRSSYDQVEIKARHYLNNQPFLSYKDLALSSQELMDLGYKGPQLGQVLDRLATAVLGGLDNTRDSLLNYLKNKNK